MPNKQGLGYGRATPYKQYALDTTLGPVMGSGIMVARQRGQSYRVLDMTAGPGVDPHGREGSPLILARHVVRWQQRGHRVTLACVDRDADALARLRTVMAERFPCLPVDYFTSQTEALAGVPGRAVGLTYWDTTRYNDLDAGLLSQFGRSHRVMDILLTRECLAGYRMQKAAHCRNVLTIQDYLALTGKTRNYILQYAKWNWWALGFADNWEERPAHKLRGFADVRTREGMAIWRQWTHGAPPLPESPDAGPRLRQEALL